MGERKNLSVCFGESAASVSTSMTERGHIGQSHEVKSGHGGHTPRDQSCSCSFRLTQCINSIILDAPVPRCTEYEGTPQYVGKTAQPAGRGVSRTQPVDRTSCIRTHTCPISCRGQLDLPRARENLDQSPNSNLPNPSKSGLRRPAYEVLRIGWTLPSTRTAYLFCANSPQPLM
jgi:hypothetical protein